MSLVLSKLRRPGFRLRAFLAIVAVMSVPLVVLGWRERAYRVRLAAVNLLRDGEVYDVGLRAPRERRMRDFDRPCVAYSVEFDGFERGDVVIRIDATGRQGVNDRSGGAHPVSEEEISAMLCFPTLRCLDLSKVKIADAQLAKIATLRSLAHLNFRGAPIGDEGVRRLDALRVLRSCNLSRTKISDAALEGLASLRELEVLDLSGTNVTADGIRHLAELCALRELDLSDTKISDAAFAHASNWLRLKELSLHGDDIGDGSLRHLARLPKLTWLDLSETCITDEGLRTLARFKTLQYLNLENCAISDAGLMYLSQMKPLKYVSLVGAKSVTAAGVERLKKLNRGTEVY